MRRGREDAAGSHGPGEAKEADIGLTGASPKNLIYASGKPHHKVSNEGLLDDLEKMIRARVSEKEKNQDHLIVKSSLDL